MIKHQIKFILKLRMLKA